MVPQPWSPVDAISIAGVFTPMVQAVGVGTLAVGIPPTTLVFASTVPIALVIVVSVVGAECPAFVMRQGVTCNVQRTK